MKIAVASSGLGHVARGIETWARDTAEALGEKGVDVTLFAGAGGDWMNGGMGDSGIWGLDNWSIGKQGNLGMDRPTVPNHQIIKSSNQPMQRPSNEPIIESSNHHGARVVVLKCFRRHGATARRLTRLSPRWAWRWGLKSAYGWEQFSFWWHLWPKLRAGRFDVLHVQDPMLAYWCRRARRMGLVRTKEILAHGTEEPTEFLAQFDYVQHLAPWHLQQAREALAANGQGEGGKWRGREWAAMPNFVDTDVFRPARSETERAKSRESFG
ncbi:MAG: hypothetical protein HQ559_01305, partial [Lentisphaerae bacterium]|nr:hypothetical protein [Lentisphaerota bacterium]